MTDYRIDAIVREVKNVEDRIHLIMKCLEVGDTLMSIRDDKSVVENHSDKFITGFDSHIAAIVHDLYQIAYTTDYDIGYTLDGVKLSLRNLEESK